MTTDSSDRPDVAVRLDVNGFFDHMIGDKGYTNADVDALAPQTASILEDLAARRAAGELPFYELPYDAEGLGEIESLAATLRSNFDKLIVLGIGGSALGTKAVLDAVPRKHRSHDGLEVVVLDNVDPVTIQAVMAESDPRRTAINVISKSGGTAETLAQFLCLREWLERAKGPSWGRAVVVTTDKTQGPLRAIADGECLRSAVVPDGVGGRFSVLSAVGLLPLAAAGVNVGRLLAGARHADARCKLTDLWANPAALHAALLVLSMRSGRNIHVLMPYADGLLRLAEWYGQLWAESLGKRNALDGSLVEVGQTPVRAVGATDQHSQVQLYVEGPHDKVVTFLRVEKFSSELVVPAAFGEHEQMSYLAGLGISELLNMEQKATELALARAGRQASCLVVDALDEFAMGQLFHLFEVQTLVSGGLLGIDPLDQPGVEAGKKMTFALAGRAGFEDEAAEIERVLARKRDSLVLG